MATWRPENAILTQKGIEILNKIKVGEGHISITRIVCGSGRVPFSYLYTQDHILGEVKEMTISGKNILPDSVELNFYISNEDFTAPFTLQQIGIYVTHPDYEGEQLYHISQCDEDDPDVIPVMEETESPVVVGYSLDLETGNSDNIDVTIDPQGAVLCTTQINGKPLMSDLHFVPKDFDALPQRNLIDNPFFQVNHLEAESYSLTATNAYCFDRWQSINDNDLTVSKTGKVISVVATTEGEAGGIRQYIAVPASDMLGETMTLTLMLADDSVLTKTDKISGDSSDFCVIELPNGMFAYLNLDENGNTSVTVEANNTPTEFKGIKLEFSDEQTLCYDIADRVSEPLADPIYKLYEDYDYTADVMSCNINHERIEGRYLGHELELNAGAKLSLSDTEHSNAGAFSLVTANDKSLTGKTDGTLSWNGDKIVFENGVQTIKSIDSASYTSIDIIAGNDWGKNAGISLRSGNSTASGGSLYLVAANSNKVAQVVITPENVLSFTGNLSIGGSLTSTNSSATHIGYSFSERTGGLIAFNNKNNATNAGGFEIYARDNTKSRALTGDVNGSLAWDGSLYLNGHLYARNSEVTTTNIGYDYVTRAGGLIAFRPVTATVNAGGFEVHARDANNSKVLSGTVNGDLSWDGRLRLTNSVLSTADANNAAIACVDANNKIGGCLYLFTIANTTYKGGFLLRAETSNGTKVDFAGLSDGTLRWNGKNIVRSVNNAVADSNGNVTVPNATSTEAGILRAAGTTDELNCQCTEAAVTPENLYKMADFRLVETAYVVGDKVNVPYNAGLLLECTQAGTTSEQFLDTHSVAVDQVLVDGTVRWTVRRIVTSNEMEVAVENAKTVLVRW